VFIFSKSKLKLGCYYTFIKECRTIISLVIVGLNALSVSDLDKKGTRSIKKAINSERLLWLIFTPNEHSANCYLFSGHKVCV